MPDTTNAEVEFAAKRIEPNFGILDDLQAFFRRFIYLSDDSLYFLVSLWTVGTHLHQQFDFFGYLFIHSPEPESGKSRLLELLHEITLNPSEIVVEPTAAVLFRTAANTTYLLDEVDGWTNKEDLRSVLNAGFQKGRSVVRLKESDGSYAPEKFKVYAPRALAGIGTEILDRVTRGRTFMIRMVRQKRSERREPFRPKKLKPELDKLRKGIHEWLGQRGGIVRGVYEADQFPYLQAFGDRTIDVSQSLAAILEAAYVQSPQTRTVRETLTRAIEITRGEQQKAESGSGHTVLRELTLLAKGDDPLIGNPSELTEKLRSVRDNNNNELEVSAVLRKYDFKARSKRLPGEEQPRYRYVLPYSELKDLYERYFGEESVSDTEDSEV